MTLIQEVENRFLPGGGLGVLVCLVIFVSCGNAQAQSIQNRSLGQPGYVVIEAARDSVSGFVWETETDSGIRTLIWEEGRLKIPAAFLVEDFGRRDIGFACTKLLSGSGASGKLIFQDGIFPVSEPVVLTDGVIELQVEGGELEIRGAMIRYRRPAAGSRDFKSGLLLLAGMTLLIIVLLRRARLKSGERSGL